MLFKNNNELNKAIEILKNTITVNKGNTKCYR
jgi:hypothetical protein